MSQKERRTREWHFEGFGIPESNYFKMPNEWTDITAKITSLAELKVVEYVLRHTWGYQEFGIAKKITTDEFMRGRKRKDGTRLDQGTGLSNRSVIDGLRRAVDHGLLIEEIDDSDRARVKKYYALRMRSVHESTEQQDMKNLHTESSGAVKNLHTGVKNLHGSDEDSSQRSEKHTLETHQQDVVDVLGKFKISPGKARELAQKFSTPYIHGKTEFIEWLLEAKSAGRPIQDPAGWLIRAIEEDYQPPKAFKSKADRAIEAAEAERWQQELEKEKQAELEKARALREQIISTYKIPKELVNVWGKVLDQLGLEFDRSTFSRWFEQTHLLSREKESVVIGVESPEALEWLTARSKAIFSNTLAGFFGEKMSIQFELLDLG